MAKEMFVFRIEYEKLSTMSSWTTFIAAHDLQEAENYIQKVVGPIRIMIAGMHSRLDSVTFEVRDRIVNAYMGKNVKIEEIVIKNEPKESKKAEKPKLKKK